MVIYHAHRTIFVHIPKTGGRSVCDAFGFGWPAHSDIALYAEALQPDVFDAYFKFAVVRNPWARLVSEYNFQQKKRGPRSQKLFVYDERGGKRGFSEWVRTALADPFAYGGRDWGGDVSAHIHRWSPQVEWISLNGRIAVDFVARLEGIRDDFRMIAERAGLPVATMPRRNAKWHWHYSSYYDRETRDLVGRYYEADVETFGYRFEPCSRLAYIRRRSLKRLGLAPVLTEGARP